MLEIVKHSGDRNLGETIRVAHYSAEPGIPAVECTLYLEPYSPDPHSGWKLLDGSGSSGVSHVGDPVPYVGR